jgi:hypothetical protein
MPNLIDLLGQVSLFAKLTMAVAIVAFGLAVAYVFRPTEQKLVLMRPVSLAAIFATVSGLLGGWIAVLGGLAATADGHLAVASVYRGIAESLTVGFVSFGLLAAAWMLVAAGVLRRAATLS